jgi:phosphoglycerol transferase MdoB-like AlkP superfamily enzyme
MTSPSSPKDFPWKRSRFGFAAFFFCSLLACCFVLRVVLLLRFGSLRHEGFGTGVEIFLVGFHQDILAALITTLPLLCWFAIVRDKTFGRLWQRVLLIGGCFLFWSVRIFLYFAEYYFFEEFKSRFNTVAVDYLLYPYEVFVNIWDSYPVTTVVLTCCGLSLAWVIVAFRYFRQMWFQPTARLSRYLQLGVAAVLCAVLVPTVSLSGSRVSSDRTLNEIANNGSLSFYDAAVTHDLDYRAFYRTLPRDVAYARVRQLLASPDDTFVGGPYSIRRHVAGDASRPRLNVVILMEESLGSEFWGSLGRKGPSLTPEMDKLATTEGLFFTNIYACGNRTVRGFEGVLSSFPPLPGDAIVKRDRSENVETIARVLKRDGYNTIFFYGGRGIFDNMSPFTLHNGYDRFLEHNPPFHDDFPHPEFATVWGVCDEEVYDRAIQEFRALAATGKPFLGTVMSVSNHKPFTYPRGRIPEDPDKPKRTREKAVKYSDWALGHFFEQAKMESFWTNTVFVVVADHGARVYGSQDIPIFSYEIPLVILGPAVVKEPKEIGTLGSSLDVSPTVLGLIGRPYESMFFGRDLLHDPPDTSRALLNHNRDVGMFSRNRMVVLGLQKTVEYYAGNPKVTNLQPVTDPTPEFRDLATNTMAIFQVADDLYMHRLYRIDGMPLPAEAPAGATNAVPR